MTDFFNFYPADGSATVTEIPTSEVTGTPDDFGCIETPDGLYVPTMKMEFVSLDVAMTDEEAKEFWGGNL